GMAGQRLVHQPAGLSIPDPDRLVAAAGCDQMPVRAEGDAFHLAAFELTESRPYRAAGGDIPEPDHSIPAACDQLLAIRAEGRTRHIGAMTPEWLRLAVGRRFEWPARGHVPECNPMVAARRRQNRTVWTEDDDVDVLASKRWPIALAFGHVPER